MQRVYFNKRLVLLYTVSILSGIFIGYWTGCRKTHRKITRKPSVRKPQLDHQLYAKQKLDPSLANDVTLFNSKVSLVTFCKDQSSIENLDHVLKVLRGVKVLVGVVNEAHKIAASRTYTHVETFSNKAEAVNQLISKVDSDYFLYLDEYHRVESTTSGQSIGWLLESLEKIKSLDILGGSVHVEGAYNDKYNTLEVPCYRLHHYNYTYSETYEYKESILDAMVCERTSTSFLANTATYKQSGLSFDPQVKNMMFEDFFLQAKKRGIVVGTKPEVHFVIHKSHKKERSAVQHIKTDFVSDLIPFGLKHQVMTIVDMSKQILYICERYSAIGNSSTLFKDEELLCNYDKTKPYWKMEHWAYGGMYAPPTMMFALNRGLKISGDFFDEKGWTWGLSGGAALGAVKLRGLLPWEAGDIDLNMNLDKQDCLNTLQKEFVPKHPDYEVIDHDFHEIIIRPKHGFGGYVTIFFGYSVTDIKRAFRMNVDGYQASVPYQMFKEHRTYYGVYFLQHKQYKQYFLQPLRCSEDSNSCLPDYSKLYNGRGGIWREFFVEK